MQSTDHRYAWGLSLLAAASLAACFGGSDDSATTLSGVAATGSPLAGATVTVSDSDASTPDKTVTSGADGSYSVDVTGMKTPLVVKVNATFQGAPLVLVAVVPTVSASGANTANVTPFTNAVAALVAPQHDTSKLLSIDTLKTVSADSVSKATTLLVATLNTDPNLKSALGSNFDPLTTKFNADGTGVDAVLDKLDVAVSSSGVAITSLAAQTTDTDTTPPAPVILTHDQAATQASAPTLPTSAASGDTPAPADIALLGAKLQACLAIPLAQRVTFDGAGNVTQVNTTCDFAPSDWRSQGRTWVQQAGQYFFAKSYVTGATAGKGQIVLATKPFSITDPKTFKHPYCNTKPCVVVRYPFTTPSGQTFYSDWTISKTDSGWNFVGNQLPYNLGVNARLRLYRGVNTTPSASSTTNPYFFKDRFESRLLLGFDLTVRDTSNVRAARFTGPGLPDGGVILFRSQECETADHMAIRYHYSTLEKSNTRNLANNLQIWTGATTNEFKLDAANLDGSSLQMPAPVRTTTVASFQDFSDNPVANQSTVAPAWSVYKVEVYHYDTSSDTPDEIVYVRTDSPAENASAGVTKNWPSLTKSVIDDFLNPGGSKAGTLGNFAQTALNWTGPAGGYVGSAWIYGSNYIVTTNSQNESDNYGLRNAMDFDPLALGDTSATGYRFADIRSGTELSNYTKNDGTNPNPRCSVAPAITPITTSAADYREIGLSFRGSDRKLYQAIWMWQN